MTRSYVQRKAVQRQETPKQKSDLNPAQGSPTTFGADLSSSGASGHPVDLPGAIREKFENAFGADLSAVRFYRSQAVADAGAQAVTMGEKVVFAPGMLDFSSRSGQTLLGHELSHVVSQQRGEVTGSGYLNDPALEARADREGAMAAAGEEIAAPTAAMSSATAASASGPMQAKKNNNRDLAAAYNAAKHPIQFDADDSGADSSLSGMAPAADSEAVDVRRLTVEEQDDEDLASHPVIKVPTLLEEKARNRGDDEEGPLLDNDMGLPDINNPYRVYRRKGRNLAATPAKLWGPFNTVNGVTKSVQGIGAMLAGTGNAGASYGDDNMVNTGAWGSSISPGAAGVLGGMGMLTGTATFLSSFGSALRGAYNVGAGGSKADPIADAALAGGGLSSATSGAFSLVAAMTKIPKIPITPAAKTMSKMVAGGKLIPGLSLITGTANFGAGLYQGIRGASRYAGVKKQIEAMERSAPGRETNRLSEDQQKMLRTMRHGGKIQKRNSARGFWKSAGGLLSGIGAATTLGGVTAPVGFALGALGAGAGAVGEIYNLARTRSIRRDVLAEELGVDFKHTVADVKKTLKGKTRLPITDDRAWKVFLASKGFQDEKALYAYVRKKRAAHMLHMAKNGNSKEKNLARAFMESMGVRPVNGDDYAEGALDILTEKLG